MNQPTLPGFDPLLSLTVTRDGKEVYTIHGIPQFGATELAVALTKHDKLVEALQLAVAALNTAPRFKVPSKDTDSYAIAATIDGLLRKDGA